MARAALRHGYVVHAADEVRAAVAVGRADMPDAAGGAPPGGGCGRGCRASSGALSRAFRGALSRGRSCLTRTLR